MAESSFTPEEIQEILNNYFENFAHRQYIGQRYVPIFGRKDEESIAWDNTKPYEPLTIVLYQGNSYTSRQFVPADVDISNQTYWANTGNYNAQIEAYRLEVTQYAEHVADLERQLEALEELNYVTLPDTIDKTGVTDCSEELNEIIENLNKGDVLLFSRNATYRFDSTVYLKTNVTYDFNNSNIIYNGANGLYASGTLKESLVSTVNYQAGNEFIQVSSVPNDVHIGDIIVIRTSERLVNTRSYYYKGFSGVITNIVNNIIYMDNAVPYNISSGANVAIYEPCTVNIENIASITTENDVDAQQYVEIALYYNKNSIVRNIKHTQNSWQSVGLYQCQHCLVTECVCEVPPQTNSANNPNPYFYVDWEGNANKLSDTHGYSNWHLWTTGGQITTTNSTVEWCTHASTTQPSYADHDNSIGSKVLNCSGTRGVVIGPNSVVENLYVFQLDDDNTAVIRPIMWTTFYTFLNYKFENIYILNTVNSSSGSIRLYGQNGSGGDAEAYYANQIIFDNVHVKFPVNLIHRSTTNIRSLYVSNCNDIYLRTATHLTKTVCENCNFQNIRTELGVITNPSESSQTTEVVRLTCGGYTFFNDCYFSTLNADTSNIGILITGVSDATGYITFNNCNFHQKSNTELIHVNSQYSNIRFNNTFSSSASTASGVIRSDYTNTNDIIAINSKLSAYNYTSIQKLYAVLTYINTTLLVNYPTA